MLSDIRGVTSFRDWSKVQPDFHVPSKTSIDQVKAICSYVFDTYGRIPATSDTKLIPVWLQVHHLDIDFYDKYLAPGIITEAHRQHMQRWHK